MFKEKNPQFNQRSQESVLITRDQVIVALKNNPYGELATKLYSNWCKQEGDKWEKEGSDYDSWKNLIWDRIQVQYEAGYLAEALHQLGNLSQSIFSRNPHDEWLEKCSAQREKIENILRK